MSDKSFAQITKLVNEYRTSSSTEQRQNIIFATLMVVMSELEETDSRSRQYYGYSRIKYKEVKDGKTDRES